MKKHSMMKILTVLASLIIFINASELNTNNLNTKKLAYLVSDINIPFWKIMAKGIQNKAIKEGYEVEIYSSNNLKKEELSNLSKILKSNVDGLIISPINSSTAVTILKLAKLSKLPVVISDIGANKGEYVSFVSSNNKDGAYEIGKILAKKMKQLNWDKQGTVGIIAISQKRANGKARTEGFMKAMKEANIKSAGLLQIENFSDLETYKYSIKLIKDNPNLRAIWLQTSNSYKGALSAIKDMHKEKEVLLISFDSEPEFLNIIPKGTLIASAMQQPYLMGEKSVELLDKHIKGFSVEKNLKLNILAISAENIQLYLPIIKKNVLGIEE